MKKLIVTADDFGYSSYANKAIIRCFRKGIVTSTSLLANTNHFDDSVKLLKLNKNLDVGIHINLTEFRPLTIAKTMTGKDGNFIGKDEWFNGFYKKASKVEIENEIGAQIERAFSAGLRITHINGHNHIHIFPKVMGIALRLAKKHNIKYIRLPDEKIVEKSQRASTEIRKRNLMSKFSEPAKSKIIKSRLKTSDAFYGILNMNDMDFGRLAMILKSIKNGTSELMVHPSYMDKKGDEFHRLRQREKEIKMLTGKMAIKAIKKLEISLTNFSLT